MLAKIFYFLTLIYNFLDDCPDGTAYSMVINECERCIIGYYRKKTETVGCVKCPLGKTTVNQGASSCVDSVSGKTQDCFFHLIERTEHILILSYIIRLECTVEEQIISNEAFSFIMTC